jgi:hypothetical protein
MNKSEQGKNPAEVEEMGSSEIPKESLDDQFKGVKEAIAALERDENRDEEDEAQLEALRAERERLQNEFGYPKNEEALHGEMAQAVGGLSARGEEGVAHAEQSLGLDDTARAESGVEEKLAGVVAEAKGETQETESKYAYYKGDIPRIQTLDRVLSETIDQYDNISEALRVDEETKQMPDEESERLTTEFDRLIRKLKKLNEEFSELGGEQYLDDLESRGNDALRTPESITTEKGRKAFKNIADEASLEDLARMRQRGGADMTQEIRKQLGKEASREETQAIKEGLEELYQKTINNIEPEFRQFFEEGSLYDLRPDMIGENKQGEEAQLEERKAALEIRRQKIANLDSKDDIMLLKQEEANIAKNVTRLEGRLKAYQSLYEKHPRTLEIMHQQDVMTKRQNEALRAKQEAHSAGNKRFEAVLEKRQKRLERESKLLDRMLEQELSIEKYGN